MENKKDKFKLGFKISLLTLLMSLSVILCVSVRNTYIKADYLSPQPFIEINEGFDKYWQYYKSGVNPSNNQFNRSYIDYYFGSNYGYYTFDLSSDNPDVNTIICTIILDDLNDDRFIDSDTKKVLECGFVSGDLVNNYSILDDCVLPYYICLSDYQKSYVGFIDISDLNIYLEGYTYFVCRVSDPYLDNNGIGNAPQFLFWDLNLNANYNDIYDSGYRQGIEVGYYRGRNDGVSIGYSNGYAEGQLNPSNDYHISDLLFAIFDAPYQVLYNLFSFTIFGTSMWVIIVSLLTLAIVLWVVKKFIGFS